MDEMFSLRMNERGCQCKAALFLYEENPALDAGLVFHADKPGSGRIAIRSEELIVHPRFWSCRQPAGQLEMGARLCGTLIFQVLHEKALHSVYGLRIQIIVNIFFLFMAIDQLCAL